MTDESHNWGPHHAGLRWVECRACTALLHEPEAQLPCTGEPSLVEAGRRARREGMARAMERIAVAESGGRPVPGLRRLARRALGL